MAEDSASLSESPAACVCCRLSGETCDRPYLQGTVSGQEKEAEERRVRLRLPEGGEVRIRLAAGTCTDWQAAILDRACAPRETPLAIGFMHLSGGPEEWRFTRHSLFVLEPDWLFSVSDATHFEFCDRQRLVSFYQSDAPGLPLIRGNLVHQLFPVIWNGCEAEALDAALERALEDQALTIGLAGLDPAKVAADARLHLLRLKRWADGMRKQSELVSETFRLSPGWGLKGRIDAVWERPGVGPVILGELKTGRSRGRQAARAQSENGEAELGHIFQVVSYAAMLMARGEIKADPLHVCLLYSGNPDAGGKLDILRKVALTGGRLREAADVRNRLALMEMGEPPGFKDRLAACNRCRCNEACDTVAGLAGHDDPRDLAGAEWDRAPAERLEEADSACFRHYAGQVRAELAAVRGELARLWKTAPGVRLAEGRAVRLRGEGVAETLETGEGRRPIRRYGVDGVNHSEFRAGDTVLLSDAAGPVRGRAALGTVMATGPADMALAWEAEPGLAPAWVDAYPDEKLTRRQLSALYRFLSKPSRLKEVLVRGTRAPERDGAIPDLAALLAPEVLARLGDNVRQCEAVAAALRTRDVLLVAGPPGSGKTMLIGALVEAMLRQPGAPRVLLVAATNRALDQALEKVAEPSAVRLGGDSVVPARIRPLTLAARLDGVAAGGAAAAVKRVMGAARVVGVTASTLAGGALDAVLGEFEWVVMDEASQMTVPLGLGAASYGKRLILIGDDRQLAPVVRAEGKATGEWPALSVSLFELVRDRLAKKGPVLVELERLYRMSVGVGAAPAAVWYGGRLSPGTDRVAGRRLEGLRHWKRQALAAALDPDRAVLVVDVPGAGRPRVHDGEAAWIGGFLAALAACGGTVAAPDSTEGLAVAIISPYRAQVARIRTLLGGQFPEREPLWRACVDTVDRFQGGEADVVLVSLCPPEGVSEHLANPRRLNVALTRARSKVILLGDCRRLSAYPVFQRLFGEYESRWPGGAWRMDGLTRRHEDTE
jgi:DNA replication ATP-dependent helicase Dna2